jgi:hypothetical protein
MSTNKSALRSNPQGCGYLMRLFGHFAFFFQEK